MKVAPSLSAASGPSAATRLLAIACLSFFAIGMGVASLGPLLPDLARQTGVDEASAGALLFVLPAGGFLGQTVAGLWSGAIGARNVLLTGMGLYFVSILGVMASPGLASLLACGFCLGAALGAMAVIGNVLAAEASDGAGPLNLVNAMFGVGAIVSPALIGASLTWTGTGLPAIWTVPCILLIDLLLLIYWLPQSVFETYRAAEPPQAVQRGLASAFGLPALWLIGGLVLVYVATEASVNGWLPTLLDRGAGMPIAQGSMVASWFWLVHTTSRFCVVWAGKRLTTEGILAGGVFLCFLGAVVLAGSLAASSPALAAAAATLLGMGIGPILPAALALARRSLPIDLNVAMVLVMGFGAFGNVAVIWALGALIFRLGAQTASLAFIALPLAMAGLLAAMRRHGRAKTRTRASA